MSKVFAPIVIGMLAFAPAFAAAEPNPYDGPVMPKFDFSTDVTPLSIVHHMLKMANVGPGDFVIDLGSGDGRIAITAAKHYGARALGVDLNPEMIAVARKNAARSGVEMTARFIEQDVLKTDLTGATVVTAVIWPNIHVKLRPMLLEKLAPGARVVTNLYHMGEWKADKTAHIQAQSGQGPHVYPIYLWIVPARIEGDWRMTIDGQGVNLRITRKYQFFSGSGDVNGRQRPIGNGRIEGTKATFDFAVSGKPVRYTGHVQPDGTLKGDAWSATRN